MMIITMNCILCILLYFIKCICWSIYWIHETALCPLHKIY